MAAAFVAGCATTGQGEPSVRPITTGGAVWPTRETYCREAREGVGIVAKRTRAHTFECLTDGGDFRTVRVVGSQREESQ